MNNKMIERISAKEFRNSGALMIANQLLHVFGLCIVVDMDTDLMYPAKTKFRGMSEESQDRNYKNITEYLRDNMDYIKEGGIEEIDKYSMENKYKIDLYSGLDEETADKLLKSLKEETMQQLNDDMVIELKKLVNKYK